MKKMKFLSQSAKRSTLAKALTFCTLSFLVSVSALKAGPETSDNKDMKSMTPPACGSCYG